MKRFRMALILAFILVLATVGMAAAQSPAYQTPFTTAVTYQNVGSAEATIVFNFYPEMNAAPITVNKTLAAGAGSSLFMGNIDGLPQNFTGSGVLSSDGPIVATLVQIPTSTTVKNRPLSNGFSQGATDVRIPSVLKNRFNQTSRFSVQNADSSAIDIKIQFYDVANPSTPIDIPVTTNVPVGAAKVFDAGTLSQLGTVFNGSAVVTAVKTGTTTPANIVASAMELSTNGNGASAFEGTSTGAVKVYMASALCNAFGGQTSFYAVQNTGGALTEVTVTYSNGETDKKSIEPGAKQSFNSCTPAANDGLSGSATITADQPLVVLGKVSGNGLSTAFLGSGSGSQKVALPYVRWASNDKFNNNGRQRAYVSVQNVGGATVDGVKVMYLNKNGEVVGSQTLDGIADGSKKNSNPSQASVATGHTQNELNEFGTPDANPGGGFGGAVIVEGPAGSQLVAVVRIVSADGAGIVGEDYNGIPIQ